MSTIIVENIERADGVRYGTTLLPEIRLADEVTSVATFTGIPSDAKEIKVMFRAVSSSLTNNFRVQLGTPSGWITTGYDSISTSGMGDVDINQANSFIIMVTNASDTLRGQMIISRFDDNTWVQTGGFKRSPTSTCTTYGDLVSAPINIDRIRIGCTGLSIFDTGRIAVSYTI